MLYFCRRKSVMTKKVTYEQLDRGAWEAFVGSSATGTWFQSPEAYDFFASLPEVFAPFAVGVTRDGELRGVCVGYVTKERSRVREFFTRRAIINGGPVLAEDASEEEVETLMNSVRGLVVSGLEAPIYIETRNFHDYSRWKSAFEKAGFEYRQHLNFHIDCRDKEAMWERLSKTRRWQIRRAKEAGVTIKSEGIREEEIRAYYAILSDLYRRKVKTPLFPEEVFVAFFRQGRGVYLLVEHEGRVIGGVMCPILADKCIYEWFICGLDERYKELYPSVMATWAVMEYAHEKGLPLFDIMGAGVPGVPYGVRDFKALFGGKLVEHGRFVHVAKPMLYKIGEIGVRIVKRC